MIDAAKRLLKKFLFYSGIMRVYHSFNNKKVLTVVAFHRVVNQSDYRWPQTDKEWVVTDTFLNDCLVFFKKYYTLVSLNEVISATKSGFELPNYPLLVTFDDGWKDNYDYAFPLVKKYNIPITIFCATEAINGKYLNWREVIYALSNLNKDLLVNVYEILSKYNISFLENISEKEIIDTVLASTAKQDIINEINHLTDLLGEPNQMLNEEEILEMKNSSLVSIAAHGHTHEPLLVTENPQFELNESKSLLSSILNENIESMAYPHSSVDTNVYKIASKCGFKYQFAGRNHLNIVPKGENNYFFGRTPIHQQDATNKYSDFAPELLALSLFRLQHKPALY